MTQAVNISLPTKRQAAIPLPPNRIPRHINPLLGSWILQFLTISFFFALDLVLPRGATPAIGYALLPVLAASNRKFSHLLFITALCTVLTWIGYFFEPAGATWWYSVFERAMVSMVLWLTFLLVNHRLHLLESLAHKTAVLERTAGELQRSNQELDRFASIVAHDLRGPLNAVGLTARLIALHSKGKTDSETEQSLNDIDHELQSAGQLVQRLLSYARVGGAALIRSTCDLDVVLASALHSLAGRVAETSAVITHDPLPTLSADPLLIRELLQNLIENAIKYRGRQSPRIHVAAEHSLTHCTITVQDNGIGIEPKSLQNIFAPFNQADPRDRTAANGIGLGLATCKRIAQRHGGEISCSSVPGQGSTFSITLPLDAM